MAKIRRTKKDLVNRNDHLQYGSSDIYYKKLWLMPFLKRICQMSRSKSWVPTGRQGIFMWNIKANNHKVIVLKKVGQARRSRSQGKKKDETQEEFLSHKILMWDIKAQSLTDQKFLARLQFQTNLLNNRMTEWQNDRQL